MTFPSFETFLPDLDDFIHELVQEYQTEEIRSWESLEKRVDIFFTTERMDQVETVATGWRKMASYADGVTLVHVLCVFLGLFMMPEYLGMTQDQQGLMKWVILFHDIEKEVQNGKRDHFHAFRSAIAAARALPRLGFSVTSQYNSLIDDWSEITRSANTKPENSKDTIQDNRKLPEILSGVEHMFGHNTPAALIVKTILFHLSVDMKNWPPAAPLTNEEIGNYFDADLFPLLKAMHLADNDGWTLFEPSTREHQRIDIIEVFEKIEHMIVH